MTAKTKIWVLLGMALASIMGVSFLDPIAQPLSYHDYADQRAWMGIAHFGNTMSNLPFLVLGLMGLVGLRTDPRKAPRLAWFVFFLGITLTAFGSAYYHLNPNNQTLVWDRIPMAVAFAALFAIVVMRHLSQRVGLILLGPLLLAGVLSVFYWQHTELLGRGDLRPYLLVQFLPLVLIPMILAFFPVTHYSARNLLIALAFYLLAKVFELADAWFYALAKFSGGHAIKHLIAATAIGFLWRMWAEDRSAS